MRKFRLIALLSVTVVIAAACSSGDSSSDGSGGGSGGVTEGGFLKIAQTEQIDSLNPFVAFNLTPFIIFMQEYPALVQYAPDLTFQSDFATSWSHNTNFTEWTFHTVPNAKWSDGEPLTAEDVAWTLNTTIKYKDGPTAHQAGYIAHMTSAKATDANTVVLHYESPVTNALAQMVYVYVLPEQVWGRYATGDGKAIREFPNTPEDGKPVVSGGPFMLTEYKQDQVAKFALNPNWYGTKPHIEGFGFQYFATNDAAVQSMKTGVVDMLNGVPTTAMSTLKQAGLTVAQAPGTTYHEIIINSNPKAPIAHPELQDPSVRQAMSHAINYDEIVKTAWSGFAEPGYSIIPPASGDEDSTGKPWTDPSLEPYTYDPAQANQILDDAGYTMGPHGYRMADGHEMKYNVIFPHYELGSGMRSFDIVQGDFKAIGIGITSEVMNDNAAYYANIKDEYTDFDLIFWSWSLSRDPDFSLSVLTCEQWYNWNDSAYCNPAYDKLYTQQSKAAAGGERLQQIYQMQQMVYEDMPYLVLNYQDDLTAWSNKWTGFVPSEQDQFNGLTSDSKNALIGVHQVG